MPTAETPKIRSFRVTKAFSKYHGSPMYLSQDMGTVLMCDAQAFRFESGYKFKVSDTGLYGMCGTIYAVDGEKTTIFGERELETLVSEGYLLET